jgi:serine/threonine-protein kinase
MGIVFKAKHRVLNRPVALKMMLSGSFAGPLEQARFQREVDAVAALRHPHIVQIYDVGDLSVGRYFTMEFVEGGSLAQKLAGMPQAAHEAAQMIATLACAVQFAHQSGFIHRDLKPANILLTNDGIPKITDFGLARSIDAGPEFTLSGARVGTPSYMAPEQAMGKAHAIGPSVDVYALGAVLYEMLTGRPPFDGESAAETERQVITDEPAPPSRSNPKVPRDLETICLKCLQKNPSRRYASAQDLADDLHRFLDGKPVLARPVGVIERSVKWARRRPTLATLLFLLTVLIATGSWLFYHENTRRTESAERQSRARQAIEAGIEQVYKLGAEKRLQEAALLLAEAANHRANADSDELEERLTKAKADVQFAQELVDVQQAAALAVSGQFEVLPDKGFQALANGYARAFQKIGLDIDAEPAAVAATIHSSPFRDMTVAALDEWALAAHMQNREAEQRKLLQIARLADPDPPWRDRLRDPAAWHDRDKLRKLADDALSAASPPPTHQLIIAGTLLRKHGVRSKGMALLHEAVRRHPTDYWVNWEIAWAYNGDKKYKEATPFFRVLVVLRPNRPWTINRLGCTLVMAGEFDEGIAHIRDALRLEPTLILRQNLARALIMAGRVNEGVAEAQIGFDAEPTNLDAAHGFGTTLVLAGRHREAIAMFRKAAALDPKHTPTIYNLAETLRGTSRHEEALIEFRKLDESNCDRHYGLFAVLNRLGRHEEAIPECDWVIDYLDPKKRNPEAHPGSALDARYIRAQYCKADSLFSLGRFAASQVAAKAFLDVPYAISKDVPRQRIIDQLALAEQLLPLEPHLAAIFAGVHVSPKEPAMAAGAARAKAAFAEWCWNYKSKSVTAVRIYEDAFVTEMSLADDLRTKHRFRAACAAAIAASGADAESTKLDDREKAVFRQKAFAWLKSDSLAWIRWHKEGKSGDVLVQTLNHWRECHELAGVRDETAIAQLSEKERGEWQTLWADIKALTIRDAPAYLNQARRHVDRKEWDRAAESYGQLKFLELPSDPWFEIAAAQLLAGEHDAYRQTCKQMFDDKRIRPFLVARACTLAPDSAQDVEKVLELAVTELKQNDKAFWSLTQQGALHFRANRVKAAAELFERSLAAEAKPGAAVLNWLWLALVHQKLDNTDDAHFWLNKACTWLDSVGKELPANSESLALHRHNWLEAHILRREAEALLSPGNKK